MRVSLDNEITSITEQINSMSAQLADLNQSISRSELGGDQANDLRDRRDQLVDQLSQLVDVSTQEQSNGSLTVYLDSMALVENHSYQTLTSQIQSDGRSASHTVRFGNLGIDLKNIGGKLEGMIETRDDVIMKKLQELDSMAVGIAKAVNEIHRGGKGSRGSSEVNFFDPQTAGAADIALDQLVLQDVSYIAAGQNGEPGDNSNALQIASLRSAQKMRDNKATFGDFYNSLIGEIGIKTNEAENVEQNQQALVSQIENSKQAIGGVSLDEEMANMIQYQHAYEAAARVITTMDQALDTIINGMGA